MEIIHKTEKKNKNKILQEEETPQKTSCLVPGVKQELHKQSEQQHHSQEMISNQVSASSA